MQIIPLTQHYCIPEILNLMLFEALTYYFCLTDIGS